MTSTPTRKSPLSEIEEQAERHPTRIALRSTRDCTYAELMTQMHHAVRVVQGTAPHDSQRPVLILGPTDIATAILVLGVMRAGRIVGVLDAKAPDARLREQVEAVDAAMLCVTPDQWKRASAWQIPDLPLMTSDQPASAEATLPELSQHPDAPAVLNFTSGTTGRSKAVLRSNRANQHDREWIHIARDERIERELLMRSFAQASGFTALLHVLSAGRTGVFFDLEKHSIAGLHSFIEAERIDEIALTIELHRRWLDSLPAKGWYGLNRIFII